MKFEVLISCMFEKDFSLVDKSNLKCRTLLVNQCDSNEIYKKGFCRKIDTETRGLSISRNIAIDNAEGDICLFADNDEVFADNLETTVIGAYKKHYNADIIVFRLDNWPEKYKRKARKLTYFDLLRVASFQISFKRDSVKNRINFDSLLGAGSGNGPGEENKFLIDAYRKGLKIYYVPEVIASINPARSTWFKGYDEQFFTDRGRATRYYLGLPVAMTYAFYWVLRKKNEFEKDMPVNKALVYIIKGVLKKRIDEDIDNNNTSV